MINWLEFIVAFTVFFISHSIPVRPANKARIVEWVGARGFTLGYSLLSILVLVWLIGATNRAPVIQLWDAPTWMTHLILAGMMFACLMFALAIGRPNPFSFGGTQSSRFKPETAGIVRLFRHPLLAVLALWSALHLTINGDLAHVLLFATFGGFALLGRRLIDRRKQREMGAAHAALWTQTQGQPMWQVWDPRRQTVARIAIGVIVYVLLLSLHGPVIGIYIWP